MTPPYSQIQPNFKIVEGGADHAPAVPVPNRNHPSANPENLIR